MAYYARQKRQSNFYWAELGFMAVGLLGLQPELFINLIQGSQSKVTAYENRLYAPSVYQAYDFSRDYSANARPSNYLGQTNTSYMSNPLFSQYSAEAQTNQAQGNNPYDQPMSSFATAFPLTWSNAPTFAGAPNAHPQSFSPQQYSQSGYSGNLGITPRTDHAGSSAYGQAQYGSPQYGSPQYSQNQDSHVSSGQSRYNMPQSNHAPYDNSLFFAAQPNSQLNQGTYLAQGNTAYSGNAMATDQWLSSQTNGYGNNSTGYLNATIFPPRSTSTSSRYNALVPRSAQPPLFGDSYNSNPYNSGSVGNSLSAFTYPYQPNGTNSGGWQRYQAPSSPLFR